MENKTHLPRLIDESLRLIEDVDSPGSEHKALMDLGESLLLYATAILFGEYKKSQNPDLRLEAEFYRLSRVNPSFGHFLMFYRMLSGTLVESILREKYLKRDFDKVAVLLREWTMLREVVDKGSNEDFEIAIAPIRVGRSTGSKGLQDLFDTVIVMRNIYAHPQDKAGPKESRRRWPLNEEYFQYINPFLREALYEVVGDLRPSVLSDYKPVVPSRLDDLSKRGYFLHDTTGPQVEIGIDLTTDDFNEISEGFRYLLGKDENIYVRLYHNTIPPVDPTVAKQVIEQENVRQVEPHLRRMVRDKLSNDGLIDDMEMLVLSDMSRTAGIDEARLFAIIDEQCADLRLEVRAGKPEEPGTVFHRRHGKFESRVRFNPWWLNYFAMLPNIDRKSIEEQKKAERALKGKLHFLQERKNALPQHEKIAKWKAVGKELRKERRRIESELRKAKENLRETWEKRLAAADVRIREASEKLAEQETILTEKSQEFDLKIGTLGADLDFTNRHSQWGIQKGTWRDISQYVEQMLDRTLNKLGQETGEKWVNDPNSWQIGSLSHYYWARIHPEKAPLGNMFHVGIIISGNHQTTNNKAPHVLVAPFSDEKTQAVIDPDYELGYKFMSLKKELLDTYHDRFQEMRPMIWASPKETRTQRFFRTEEYITYDEYITRKEDIHFCGFNSKTWSIPDFFAQGSVDMVAVGRFERETEAYIQLIANVIRRINDYALTNGLNEEEFERRMNRYKRHQSLLFNEFEKIGAGSVDFKPSMDQMDAVRAFAMDSLGMNRILFEYTFTRYMLLKKTKAGKSDANNPASGAGED